MIYPDKFRKDASKIFELPIVLEDGKTLYLTEIANVTIDRGLSTIRRRDGQRLAKISADVDPKKITPTEVTKIIDKKYKKEFEISNYDYYYLK